MTRGSGTQDYGSEVYDEALMKPMEPMEPIEAMDEVQSTVGSAVLKDFQVVALGVERED